MEQLKQAILKQAGESWVDLIGFAARDRFAALDGAANPFSLFPEGKTVIMVGRRITRGALRGVEEGTNLADYSMFGQSWLNDTFLSQSTFDLVHCLERAGWEAMPVMPGKSSPGVDFAYAAVACGLAEIGFDGQILTPRFGPRQRWHMILTDAPLSSDPLLDRTVCDHCGLCADLCPLGAIDKDKTVTLQICSKTFEIATVDFERCKKCPNGVLGPVDSLGQPDRTAMFCSRTCIEHLNQQGLVENRFKQPLRKRPAWRQDADGRPLPALDGAGKPVQD